MREGIAVFLSGQNRFKKKPLKYETLTGFYDEGGKGIYRESGFAVQSLVEKYGKEKMLQLIGDTGKVKTRKDFDELFRQIYGFNPDSKEFNQMLND